MQDTIIKKIIYQKKYPRYKDIFSISITEIENIGIKKFITLIRSINLNEEPYINKCFRLNDVFHKDYFHKNKGFLLITVDDIEDTNGKLNILNYLYKSHVKFKIIYKIELNDKYIKSSLADYLKKKNNVGIYIKSRYRKSELNYIKKVRHIFQDKEVYIGLDYLNRQDDINSKIIFEVINIIKDSLGIINNDLIRLESAYKGIYILCPKELHLDLYEYCNASCNFCVTNGPGFLTNRDHNENKYKLFLDSHYYINLFKRIKDAQTETLALGITGEPFLHPEIDVILRELEHIDIKVGFLTNGYKLLDNIDSILKNKNITHFYINISSGNLESFSKTRPEDNFNNFINTWNAIKIIRKKRADIIIRGLYVITPLNISGLADFINLCVKNNISEIEFKRVVPYDFSNKKMHFTKKDIIKIKEVINTNKHKVDKINHNCDYIIDEFNAILGGDIIQYTEDKNMDLSNIEGKTTNCYNPYFYISIFRNAAYTCGKFEAKIGNLTNLDLYELLFEKNNIINILKVSNNIKEVLGEARWKQKCSRCHHLDVINMVREYIKIRGISITLEKKG